MYESVVRQKNLRILDPSIIETIARNNVHFLQYSLRADPTYGNVIVAKMPDNSEDIMLSRFWVKVKYGKAISTRTPKFLREHVGKKVVFYRENVCQEDYELFRLRSVEFSIGEQRSKAKTTSPVPYFTPSGSCVLPTEYINEHFDRKVVLGRLSFNLINVSMVSVGRICAYLTLGDERGNLIYPLRRCLNGLRTRTPIRLIDFVANQGKDISHFRYFGTINQKEYRYGVIVFQEAGTS